MSKDKSEYRYVFFVTVKYVKSNLQHLTCVYSDSKELKISDLIKQLEKDSEKAILPLEEPGYVISMNRLLNQ